MSENLRQLQTLAAAPAAVAWFSDLFADACLEVTDTGERFTVRHHGDHGEVIAGFVRPEPNLVIALTSANVATLTAMFADAVIGPQEEYRIVRFMVRPCLEAALKMPILNHDMLLKILRVDDSWQQALVDPNGAEDVQLTIQKTGGQWTVSEGYHGTPRRRLRLTAPQMLDFQRRLFKAESAGDIGAWVALAKWYVAWRDKVTVPVTT
jgi:hypothetical protein